jgi:phosphopantetheinyl transferase
MPLIRHTPVEEGLLALWRLEESTGQLLSGWSLSPAEQAFYETITHPRRRNEWLAARRMIRQVLGPDASTDYDEKGRPVLVGRPGHISLSHSDETVALYYSSEPCGVDIERCTRRFDRASERYVSPAERNLPGADDNRFLPSMWCLKEAAYKWACTPGLDFIRDIRVEAHDLSAGTARIQLSDGRTILLRYEFFDGHCLAWTLPTIP